MERGHAPAGATELSPGFNLSTLGTLIINECPEAEGRKMRVPDEARTYCRAKVRVRNWDVPSDPASALLGRSIWRPLQAASLLVDDSQG
jgi:hypothetical protein